MHLTQYFYYIHVGNSFKSKMWKILSPVTTCCAEVSQSCLTLHDPMDRSPPGSSVHGILQARMLEWGCHALLQGILPVQGSNPGLCTAGRVCTIWATGQATVLLHWFALLLKEMYSSINSLTIFFWSLKYNLSLISKGIILSSFRVLRLKKMVFSGHSAHVRS